MSYVRYIVYYKIQTCDSSIDIDTLGLTSFFLKKTYHKEYILYAPFIRKCTPWRFQSSLLSLRHPSEYTAVRSVPPIGHSVSYSRLNDAQADVHSCGIGLTRNRLNRVFVCLGGLRPIKEVTSLIMSLYEIQTHANILIRMKSLSACFL